MTESQQNLPSERIQLLARMSEEAYHFHRNEAPTLPGWFKLSRSRLATVFYNPETVDVVIAYKGSSTDADRSTDFNIFHGREFRGQHPRTIEMLDPMFKAGEELFLSELAAWAHGPPVSISLTGHSLGGSIAELLALKYADEAIPTDVFNPGMGKNKSYKHLKSVLSSMNMPMHLTRHLVRNDPASLVSGNGLGRTVFYTPLQGDLDEHDIRQFTERPLA